jgi:acetylornithine deacetylase
MSSPLLPACETLLAELVAFDTVSDRSNVACAEHVADRLEHGGWRTHLFRDHAEGADKASLLAWRGPARPGGLILSGHLDIVPFADQPGWTTDALCLERRGDHLIGRGVADMKGFIAQAVVVAEAVAERDLARPLALLFTCDEELGCLGAVRLLPELERLKAEIPLPSDCVIGEPTSFRVFRAHKGHVRLELVCRGQGGHSSRPDLGVNAITAAAAVGMAVHELGRDMLARVTPEARQLFPSFPAVPFNLGTIAGGTADNMIAELCELVVAYRQVPGADPAEITAEVLARARAAVAATCPGATVELVAEVVTPAMASPADAPACRELCAVVGESDPVGAPFATDGGVLEAAGIRSWICGPAALDQAHQPDEAIPVAALDRGLGVVEQLIRRRCC